MKEKNKMCLQLRFSENEIEVIAEMCFYQNRDSAVSFYLNSCTDIEKVFIDNEEVSFAIGCPEDVAFRQPVKRVSMESDVPIYRLKVEYKIAKESLKCWSCVVDTDYISINWYSSWYPQDISIPICDNEVFIYGMEDYLLIKGDYDEVLERWRYGENHYDPYNLILYKKDCLRQISEKGLTVSCSKMISGNQINVVKDIYLDVCKYYNGDLFTKKDIPTMDIVCAPPYIDEMGGYKRNGLMWFASLNNSEILEALIAHEIAHIWCSGANVNTWEDWLNETTAEWSALIYLKYTGNEQLFDKMIQMHRDEVKDNSYIKTVDGSRPSDVHHSGVLLFYDLYKKYGTMMIEKLLKIYDSLDNKCTEAYLGNISKAGFTDVNEYMGKRIYG